VPTQRFEKWLKAADDKAAQDCTFDLNVGDPRRALHLLHGSDPHETHLDSQCW
jgi:hypothetical protein